MGPTNIFTAAPLSLNKAEDYLGDVTRNKFLKPNALIRIFFFRLKQDASRLHARLNRSAGKSSRSTPASPSRSRSGHHSSSSHHHHGSGHGGGHGGQDEPRCTCMTPEQYARLRTQAHHDPRGRGKKGHCLCEFCLCCEGTNDWTETPVLIP